MVIIAFTGNIVIKYVYWLDFWSAVKINYPMNKKNLAILYGGPTSEREVSFSTKDFFKELYAEYNPLALEWNSDFTFNINDETYSEKETIKFLKQGGYIVILASHGEYVEDGYIQQKLQDAKIRFTGSNAKSCKLAMDKYLTQQTVSSITNTIPTYQTFPSQFNWEAFLHIVGDTYPVFVKPNFLGSSVGAFIAKSKYELVRLLEEIDEIPYLFQPVIKGIEISMGTVREGEGFMELFPTEIIPKTDFFDYNAKYTVGMSEEVTPARILVEITKKIQNQANRVHEKLGLGYYSRADFILTPDLEVFYLETNPLPGMTATSLVPQQLRYSNKVEDFKLGLIQNLQ